MERLGRFLTTIPHPIVRLLTPAFGLAGRRLRPPHGLPIEADPIGRLLRSGRSLIRWGDGETRVLLGGDIAFQHSSPSLRKDLLEILRTAPTRTDLELALPAQPFLPQLEFRALQRPRVWRETRRVLPLLLEAEWLATTPRIEAHAFRTSSETNIGRAPLDPSPLLGTSQSFVLVAAERVIDRTRRAFPGSDIRTVSIPPQDAYAELPHILAELDRVHRSVGVDASTPTIVSAGPAGKVLVARRADRRQLFDLGSFHVHLPTS